MRRTRAGQLLFSPPSTVLLDSVPCLSRGFFWELGLFGSWARVWADPRRGAASWSCLCSSSLCQSLTFPLDCCRCIPDKWASACSFWKRQLLVVLRVKLPLEAAARVILEDQGGNSGAFNHSSCVFFPLIYFFKTLWNGLRS